MVTITAFVNKVVFRSKHGDVLPDSDEIGIMAAMMCNRYENEEVVFYVAKGKDKVSAEKALSIYMEAVGYDGEFSDLILEED